MVNEQQQLWLNEILDDLKAEGHDVSSYYGEIPTWTKICLICYKPQHGSKVILHGYKNWAALVGWIPVDEDVRTVLVFKDNGEALVHHLDY